MKITQLPVSTDSLPAAQGGGISKEPREKTSSEADYTVYRNKVFSDGKDSHRKGKAFAPDVEVYKKKTFET